MLLSALGFALMGALVKVCGAAGIPLLQIIAIRAVISLALSVLDTSRAGLTPWGNRRGLLLLRGVVGFLSLSCVYYAMLHLPYAEATMLQYLHPVFTAGLAFWFLREIPSKGTLMCVMLSVAGLAVMTSSSWLQGVARLDLFAVAMGLAGAFGSGLAYTIVRKLAATEHPSVIVFYFPLVCLPATLLLGVDQFVWPTWDLWLVLIGVGVFTQVGQISLTKAMALDSASRAASMSYIQIVFAATLGLLFFAEVPRLETLLGAAFILAGAVVNVRWHRRQALRA